MAKLWSIEQKKTCQVAASIDLTFKVAAAYSLSLSSSSLDVLS